jgi:hypothetical protein
MIKKKVIKKSLLIFVVANVVFGFATNLLEYLVVGTKGKLNLSKNIETIKKFKEFPNDSLFYSIILTSKDSSQIWISDTISDEYEIISKTLVVNADSLDSSYSISNHKTLLKNCGDTVKEYSNWAILYKGKDNATSVINKITNTNFNLTIADLRLANCRQLYGQKNDIMLIFNDYIFMESGCLIDNWYNYHYYLGDKSKLDLQNISYNENDAGIYYGWW